MDIEWPQCTDKGGYGYMELKFGRQRVFLLIITANMKCAIVLIREGMDIWS